MREKGNRDSKMFVLKSWLTVFAAMMAFALTCAVAIPDFGISVKAGGYINILSKTYYNTNPPKVAIKYMDPSGETKVRVCVVSKTDNGSGLGTVNIDGQEYKINSEGTTNATVEKDNGNGTKNMSAEVKLSSGSGSKLAEGTVAKLYVVVMHGEDEIGWSTHGSPRNEDIIIPPEGKSTDDSLTATPPTGETKYFNNNEWQVGVKEGAGYKLSGQYAAAKAGTYTATATLQSGYKWTDGTTAPKEIAWELKPAEIAGVTVAVWGAEDFTYTTSLSPLLYTKVTFANGYATGQSLQYNWNNKKTVENIHLSGHKPGNYTVTVTGANSNVTGSATAKYTITKNKGKFSAKARSKTSKIKKDTNKKKIVDINEFINIKNADKLTFKKLEGNKNIKIDSKKQDIVLEKGLKPGTYSVKVKITSKSDGYAYKKASQTVKFKIKVKGKK